MLNLNILKGNQTTDGLGPDVFKIKNLDFQHLAHIVCYWC